MFFIDDKNVAVCLREFKPIIRQKPISVVLSMPTKDMTDEQFKNSLLKDPYTTKLIHESLSALTSCGGLAISVFGVFSALATIATTGPVGAIIIGVGMLGTAAAATQCINGVSRIALAAGSPKTLNQLDNNKWYQAINEGLDFVSLAAVGAASYQTLKYVKLMIKESGLPIKTLLAGLTPRQKVRLQDELLSYLHKNSSPATLQFLKSQKLYLYSAKEVRQATLYQIRQSIASFLTLYSSAKGGVVHEGVKRLSKGNQIAVTIIH